MNNWLYSAKVYHKRYAPTEHIVSAKVFYICFPLSKLSELSTPIFSINKFNLFSIYTKDHGRRDGSNLFNWAKQKVEAEYPDLKIDEIYLQTFPRILGYVFNPVSFWYCYQENHLIMIIAEVNNTFGASHCYLVQPENLVADKVLHVSPFFKIKGHYKFKFYSDADTQLAQIEYFENERSRTPNLFASINGKSHDFNTRNLLIFFCRYPLMTLRVIFEIHLHALILILKKVPFFGKNHSSYKEEKANAKSS